MKFKFEGKEIEVSNNFLLACGHHAAERGMTLEEYISEAFTKLKKEASG